jgi:hypothetical protein
LSAYFLFNFCIYLLDHIPDPYKGFYSSWTGYEWNWCSDLWP